MERLAEEMFDHLDFLGDGSILEGVYAGIDDGWFVGRIADSAYRHEREVNGGQRVVVGVNAFTEGDETRVPGLLRIDDDTERDQLARLAEVRRTRDDAAVRRALDQLSVDAADPTVNLMPGLLEAVNARATVGETAHALEQVFGSYVEQAVI